jgi:hypothetical protein
MACSATALTLYNSSAHSSSLCGLACSSVCLRCLTECESVLRVLSLDACSHGYLAVGVVYPALTAWLPKVSSRTIQHDEDVICPWCWLRTRQTAQEEVDRVLLPRPEM